MRILFVADDWLGSNARSLADGFAQAGHDVVVVDTTDVTLPTRLSPPWLYAKVRHSRAPWNVEALHVRIEQTARVHRPDMLFCFKSIHLNQHRLLELPIPIKVHYSADDVSNPYNTTPEYLATEDQWDSVVTTKLHNVPEIQERGAKDVLFVRSAYDPAWHHPCATRTDRRFIAGFIGGHRPDRADLMVALARQFGSEFYVAGPGWWKEPRLRQSSAIVGGALYGEQLSIGIAPILANLVLLNSANRDSHTCRTFEVPAAGGLFVGERTQEHQAMLEDGAEALMFDDENEMYEQLYRCRTAPAEVRAIAERGFRRITGGANAYVDRARQIADHVC